MAKPKLIIFLPASLTGFLFGFDTIVISGADRSIQELWNTSDGNGLMGDRRCGLGQQTDSSTLINKNSTQVLRVTGQYL